MIKGLFKLRLGPGLVSISPLKNSLEKKNKKNVKTNILTKTPLIVLNLGKRNSLLILRKKIPKPNDKKNIDMAVKML